MKNKILLLTIISIFTTSNIFAQITWDNATSFEIIETDYDFVSAKNTTIFLHDNDGGIVDTLEQGEVFSLHSNVTGGGGVGGVYSIFEEGTSRIKRYIDNSIVCEDADGIWEGVANKGDTSVYSNSFGVWLEIGQSSPIQLVGPTGTIKGYVIMNGHVFVYSFVSADSETRIYDFDVNDLSNPVITTEIGCVTEFITFLDNYQMKQKIGEGAGYFFDDGNGWQEIDASIFGGIWYNKFALSYYGDENNICLTGLETYNGDIIQIYTASLPSAENDILTFSFTEQTGNATINSTNHIVDIEVANGTNLTNLVATFTLSDMATAFIGATEQTSGTTENDFSNLVTYTIEAENGDTQDWTIIVTEQQLNTENDILTFSFTEQTGNATINSTNHTINIEVANGTNLTNLVATFTLSDLAIAFIGTTEQTSGTTENDFTSPVIYTVEAENGDTQEWTITVTEATVGINTILRNEFSIYPNPTNGKINIETNEQIEKITILDISGKTIIETTNTEIDLSKQKTGTYFLKIETKNGIFTEIIIIE